MIGQSGAGGMRSEDLDDFIDGLAHGMSASIMVHVRSWQDTASTWREIFESLGVAVREALTLNPYRRGVVPGVKATLA